MALQIDLDVVWIDLHVLGQNGHQVALQIRQVVGLRVTTRALVGEDELQTLFGNVGSFFLFTEQEREHRHGLLPTKHAFEETRLHVLSKAHGHVLA